MQWYSRGKYFKKIISKAVFHIIGQGANWRILVEILLLFLALQHMSCAVVRDIFESCSIMGSCLQQRCSPEKEKLFENAARSLDIKALRPWVYNNRIESTISSLKTSSIYNFFPVKDMITASKVNFSNKYLEKLTNLVAFFCMH